MSLLSKEEFLKNKVDSATPQTIIGRYCHPEYVCPKCKSGGMRKDNYSNICLASLPPIYVSTYVCNECGYSEQIRD